MTKFNTADLEKTRIRNDWTYQLFADKIGINCSTLYKILTGKTRKPGLRTLHKIERFLNQK